MNSIGLQEQQAEDECCDPKNLVYPEEMMQ